MRPPGGLYMQKKIIYIIIIVLIIVGILILLVNGINNEKTYKINTNINSVKQGYNHLKQTLDNMGIKTILVSYNVTYIIKDFENEVKPIYYEYELKSADSEYTRDVEGYLIKIDLINKEMTINRNLVFGKAVEVLNIEELPEISKVLKFLYDNYGNDLVDDIKSETKENEIVMNITKSYYYKDVPAKETQNDWIINFPKKGIDYESCWEV